MKAPAVKVKIINQPSRDRMVAALLLARSLFVADRLKETSNGPTTERKSATQGPMANATRPIF